MKLEYRSTLTERSTGRARNKSYVLDTESWLAHVKADRDGMYANAGPHLDAYLLPYLDGSDLHVLYGQSFDLHNTIRRFNGMLVFEFAMFA